MEITVNGKKVVLRERYPVREFEKLYKLFAEITPQSGWEQRAKINSQFVESWELDGDPSDPESWGDLDMFTESLAIEKAILEKVLEPRYEIAKNLAAGSTTPPGAETPSPQEPKSTS